MDEEEILKIKESLTMWEVKSIWYIRNSGYCDGHKFFLMAKRNYENTQGQRKFVKKRT